MYDLNQNILPLEEKVYEVTAVVHMIRQLTNVSQIHDIVNLLQHHGALNSTVVAETTQIFAYILAYNEGTSIIHQYFAFMITDDAEERKVLSVTLN